MIKSDLRAALATASIAMASVLIPVGPAHASGPESPDVEMLRNFCFAYDARQAEIVEAAKSRGLVERPDLGGRWSGRPDVRAREASGKTYVLLTGPIEAFGDDPPIVGSLGSDVCAVVADDRPELEREITAWLGFGPVHAEDGEDGYAFLLTPAGRQSLASAEDSALEDAVRGGALRMLVVVRSEGRVMVTYLAFRSGAATP